MLVWFQCSLCLSAFALACSADMLCEPAVFVAHEIRCVTNGDSNSLVLPTQVIKLELSPGKAEEAVLCVMDVAANVHHTRAAAMFERSPLHVFMFNSQGILLEANTSALDACQRHTMGESSSSSQ